MPNWIPITINDLQDSKVAALVVALQSAALGAGQTDPTPRLTQAVVDRIRRKIASCSVNQLDADTTAIPAGLKTMAVDLILAEMKGRLEEPLTDDEQRKIDLHNSDLNRIAECRDTVEQPDSAIDAPVQDSSGNPSITCGRREKLNRRVL
ncbi:MAG TPA: hypothetical protein VNP98_17410 [Chthoniobacterales bacterium]|nr:hypothetical protein [Chthoniobacterales bacterium]